MTLHSLPDAAPVPARVPLARAPLGVFGSRDAGRRNVLELIPKLATRLPIVSGRIVKRWHMVTDPAALRHILRDRVEDDPKSMVTKLTLEPAIGDSLFVAEGAQWMWQRRAAAPVFSHRNVTALAPVMTTAAERVSARLAAPDRRAADLCAGMVAATFEVISDVTFSDGAGFDRQAGRRAIEGYISQTAKVSFPDVVGAPASVPRPSRMIAGGPMRGPCWEPVGPRRPTWPPFR